AAPPRRARIFRLPEREVVRVEVDDGTPGRFPQLGRMGFLGRRQRGLLLVNGLAQVGGHYRYPDMKTVWADVSSGRQGLAPGLRMARSPVAESSVHQADSRMTRSIEQRGVAVLQV